MLYLYILQIVIQYYMNRYLYIYIYIYIYLTNLDINGIAHKWLSSFITNRIYSVLVHSAHLLTYGVP